ncbi:hypothetical protein [Myxococcus xanthus]|uniref:hypothetical protein n=1 Tax=Myxococcus xanthus TaxID=34 RepID=UPI001F2CC18C|nr:hypothetical protein [Myxococcus xanthus]
MRTRRRLPHAGDGSREHVSFGRCGALGPDYRVVELGFLAPQATFTGGAWTR